MWNTYIYRNHKYLFAGNPNGLLLATDVAARGLDIPDVQHVIHYQVPRTTEVSIITLYFYCISFIIAQTVHNTVIDTPNILEIINNN
jgi:hypothetical protein